jgi:hypothetical protein
MYGGFQVRRTSLGMAALLAVAAQCNGYPNLGFLKLFAWNRTEMKTAQEPLVLFSRELPGR